MRRQDAEADARRGARRARTRDGRASNPRRAATPWRKAVGFSGTSIQALVFTWSVRLNSGRLNGGAAWWRGGRPTSSPGEFLFFSGRFAARGNGGAGGQLELSA